MRDRGASAPARHRASPHQEGSLTEAVFLGGWPTADFTLPTPLPEVALLGRSNVGKSSLLNALTGRKALARTSGAPGKTRECNAFRVDDRLYLLDLPGYGYARVAKTQREAFRALMAGVLARPRLTGAVWLLDLRRDPSAADLAVADQLAEAGTPVLLALTKADKVPRRARADRANAIAAAVGVPEDQCVVTSARTRDGITDLRDAIEAVAA